MAQSEQNEVTIQTSQHSQDAYELPDNNNNTIHSQTIAQAVILPDQPSIIDLCTQDTHIGDNRQNITNVENEIRSLAVNIAADTLNNVDDVLILQYAHNTTSNEAGTEIRHFNGIRLRNNSTRNHTTNSTANEQTRNDNLSRFYELGCDNAQSGMFHAGVTVNNGNNVIVNNDTTTPHNRIYNAVIGITEDLEVQNQPREIVNNGNMFDGRGDGDYVNNNANDDANVDDSETLIYETQSEVITTTHTNDPNQPILQTTHMDANEYMAHEYLQQQMPNNFRRSRPRRRRRRAQFSRGRQRNQIRRSLKSMNKILRKTAYTLRRIKSLIMQQVEMARNLQTSVPMT